MHLLFYTRLFLYILAFVVPVLHPSIIIPYDRTGWFLWFGLLPAEMFVAYYLSPPRFRVRTWFGTAAFLILAFLLIFAPFDTFSLLAVAVGSGAFLLTALVFKIGQRAESVFFIEQFLLAFLYYKILSFSRASETVAANGTVLTQIIMVLIVCAFLLHGVVLYLSVHPESGRIRGKREFALFGGILVPALLVVAFLMPPNFVNHSIVVNLLNREADSDPVPLDEEGNGLENGNLRPSRPDRENGENGDGSENQGNTGQNGRQQGRDSNTQGDQSTLEGIPSDDWNSDSSGTAGSNTQKAVMVVASKVDPIYAAEAYYGSFDSRRGFMLSEDEPLNELPHLRFLDTWTDRSLLYDRGRKAQEVFFLSTISGRVSAYRPTEIEPTILNRKHHPFVFSYRTVSDISSFRNQMLPMVQDFSRSERARLSRYLEIPLSDEDRQVFQDHLNSILEGDEEIGERIDRLLRSFSSFQYQIGFDEDVSIPKMKLFLQETKNGDCTEFSNAAAILARLSGIPSRVVTGYLASRGLQSDSHVRGLKVLQNSIDVLKEYPLNELYLVTTAHRHSWTQLYLPQYGWVDFEFTSYALPPPPGQDPNSARVVIPLLQDRTLEEPYRFPWMLLGRLLISAAGALLSIVYMYRFLRICSLAVISRGTGPRALRAISTLLLMRLAHAGYALKHPSRTLSEYAEDIPEVRSFAEAHTRLRYRTAFPPDTQKRLYSELRKNALSLKALWRKPGLKAFLKRTFSLRGLYY